MIGKRRMVTCTVPGAMTFVRDSVCVRPTRYYNVVTFSAVHTFAYTLPGTTCVLQTRTIIQTYLLIVTIFPYASLIFVTLQLRNISTFQIRNS